MSGRGGIDAEASRAQLLQRQAELERAVAENEDATKTVELDQSRIGRLSRIDALQNQEMAKETERRRNAELRRIAEALERLDGGEYGYCVNCGEEIAPKRLEFDPATPVCVGCAGGSD